VAGLKPFRHIPGNIVEWTKWMRDQVIPVESEISITESQVSDLGSYVTTALIKSGEGTPEGSVTGVIGNIYLRSDGGANTTLYVKESGNNTNTGWAAI
jgi:hypothetical protein